VLVLGASLFLPHGGGFAADLGELALELAALCAALALVETTQAKMRILRVPALLGVGATIALVGLGTWIAGIGT
jgi:formate hydrogenlyase subunit 4